MILTKTKKTAEAVNRISMNNQEVRILKIRMMISAVLAAVCTASALPACEISASDSSDNGMRDISTMELVRDMGIGINLGNTLESAGDWIAQWSDGSVHAYETAWGSPDVTKEMIQGYADEGFGVLRIPVAWTNRMTMDGTYTIDSEWMDRVTQIVDWTLDANMYAIVNIHWDYGWMNDLPTNHDECIRRFTRYWEQISDNFKDYGDHLMFEAQNEELGWNTVWNRWGGTNGKAEAYAMVNEVNQTFVDTVRASGGNNSMRHLLISGYNTDVELTCDPMFRMPDDPAGRMAVSVHYYTPAGFAILEEDADWGKASSTWGSASEIQELERNMDKLKTTFIDKGIPVIIGEYGCPVKNKEPESVRRFLSSVCREAYERQLCPVLWDVTDAQYDRTAYRLKDTELKKAYAEIVGDNIPANKKNTTPEKVKGDVNKDGEFGISDVVLVQQWMISVPGTNISDWKAADLTDDGTLDVFDLCLMRKLLVSGGK